MNSWALIFNQKRGETTQKQHQLADQCLLKKSQKLNVFTLPSYANQNHEMQTRQTNTLRQK
jgi:hypothetical protein